jgi:hypothetical protein
MCTGANPGCCAFSSSDARSQAASMVWEMSDSLRRSIHSTTKRASAALLAAKDALFKDDLNGKKAKAPLNAPATLVLRRASDEGATEKAEAVAAKSARRQNRAAIIFPSRFFA